MAWNNVLARLPLENGVLKENNIVAMNKILQRMDKKQSRRNCLLGIISLLLLFIGWMISSFSCAFFRPYQLSEEILSNACLALGLNRYDYSVVRQSIDAYFFWPVVLLLFAGHKENVASSMRDKAIMEGGWSLFYDGMLQWNGFCVLSRQPRQWPFKFNDQSIWEWNRFTVLLTTFIFMDTNWISIASQIEYAVWIN